MSISRSSLIYNSVTKCMTYVFCNTSYQYNELQNKDNSTPLFSLNGRKFTAKVVDVYDGDTITCVFKLYGKYYKWKCRISHIDTPEMKTKNKEEKERAIIVRDILREMILNKIIILHCYDYDKYGRLLVEFDLPNTQTRIHQWLLDNNYGKKYEGGTK